MTVTSPRKYALAAVMVMEVSEEMVPRDTSKLAVSMFSSSGGSLTMDEPVPRYLRAQPTATVQTSSTAPPSTTSA